MNILKWVKRLLGAVIGIIALILLIVLVLPNDFSITRSIVIGAPVEKIYPLVVTTREWKNWSVWNQRDPAMQMTFSGPPAGKDAAWDWQSKSQGNGGMKFTQTIPNQQIDYELRFEGMGEPSTGHFLFEPLVTAGASGNQTVSTKVTWTMNGTSKGNLMMKFFAPFMEKMVGPDFDSGLHNLKNLAERS